MFRSTTLQLYVRVPDRTNTSGCCSSSGTSCSLAEKLLADRWMVMDGRLHSDTPIKRRPASLLQLLARFHGALPSNLFLRSQLERVGTIITSAGIYCPQPTSFEMNSTPSWRQCDISRTSGSGDGRWIPGSIITAWHGKTLTIELPIASFCFFF